MKYLKLLAVVPMTMIFPSIVAVTPAHAMASQCVYDAWHYADALTNFAPHSDPAWQDASAEFQDANCGDPSPDTQYRVQGYWYCENRTFPSWPTDQPLPAGWGGTDCRPI